MSKWRLKGFVQDSDDEEDDLDITPPHSNRESPHDADERANDTRTDAGDIAQNEEENSGLIRAGEGAKDAAEREDTHISPVKTPKGAPSSRPTVSPFTPFVGNAPSVRPSTPLLESSPAIGREPSDSPDPLQAPLSPTVKRREKLPSSSLGAPVLHRAAVQPVGQDSEKSQAFDGFLEELGVLPLSDASDSDILSDPPSDMDEPIVPMTVFASPKRRAEVQVVIPRSTAAQLELLEQQAARSLRQRKPIQLHPYALEGEMYRRELQGRGIKPVAQPRSPTRNPAHVDAETQEQEFNPNREIRSSSPPEIQVSTPIQQRSAKKGPGSSARPRSIPERNRPVASSLHVVNGPKRRKLGRASTQAFPLMQRAEGTHESARNDMWAIPHSPPRSESPLSHSENSGLRRLNRPFLADAALDLPTPSQSSSLRGDAQPDADSGIESAARSVRRSTENRRQTFVISSATSSTSPESSDDEPEPSDSELRQARKRMKGVLPASWLRIDQEAQARRDARARRLLDANLSPDRTEPQRGVAQKITKRGNRAPQPASVGFRLNDVITISDESDNELGSSHNHTLQAQGSARTAADLAAAFDRRCADDDSDSMENDRLQLFTLGGPSRQRKKQTRLTDVFAKAKQSRGTKTRNRSRAQVARGERQSKVKVLRRTPPPALSVLDFDQSPAGGQQHIPSFLKIAKRQARQRPDYGRERPTNKHIRLQTAVDTEDAQNTLRQWRSGAIKSKATLAQPVNSHKDRIPLADIGPNARRSPTESDAEKQSVALSQHDLGRQFKAARIARQQKRPPERSALRRPTVIQQGPHTSSSKQRHVIQRERRLPRAAQLEGLETETGRSDRRNVFQQGLREVDRLFDLRLSVTEPQTNPQLARFLADSDTPLPLRPSEDGIVAKDSTSTTEQQPVPRRRLKRKVRAQRLDIDTRNYRQPSEPTLVDLLDQSVQVDNTDSVKDDTLDQPILHGLGPFGTRYSINFDISPLEIGTYFHVSTFIGNGELHRALESGGTAARDLDQPTESLTIVHDDNSIRCGPWHDETFSHLNEIMTGIWRPLHGHTLPGEDRAKLLSGIFRDSAKLLRSMITYFSGHLSFLDSIDRRSFTTKIKGLCESLLLQTCSASISNAVTSPTAAISTESIRMTTYLLVVIMQAYGIARHPVVDSSIASELAKLLVSVAKPIVSHTLGQVPQLGDFLDRNKRFAEREMGIQSSEVLVESLVVCTHVLASVNIPASSFWDIVSHELAPKAETATDLRTFESLWGTLFMLLPFHELSETGIIDRSRRTSTRKEDWALIRILLVRMFALYPSTCHYSPSINDYVRASLTRCHHLIYFWHWTQCDRMLNATYDFFTRRKLQDLRQEASNGSLQFLEDPSDKHALLAAPSDSGFHIFLKCLALGLLYMKNACLEKEVRSLTSRLTPLHGRSNPKDQPMEAEDRDALRNQHDHLCVLYLASPPSGRPKVDLLRELVNHETSHREACRLNVRAWSCLAAFQLSTNEPYGTAQPLSQWHKEIVKQTLKQYSLAKTEAEAFMKSGERDKMCASSHLVKQAMEKNQEQVIATLRDCVVGMQKAIKSASDPASSREFLLDSGLVDLLKLPHFEDTRLVAVIRDILGVLRLFAQVSTSDAAQKGSQPTSEESQDLYGGDSIDAEMLYALDEQQPDAEPMEPPLDFIQIPLWNLISNAFGAENAPSDDFLMDCVDTWALVASQQVSSGIRSWSHYVSPHGSVSWQQLSQTEQTQKFAPYFMAAFIMIDVSAYTEHRLDFFNALLLSLADRESILRFQHCLLHALVHLAVQDPLLSNLPFSKDTETQKFDITAATLRTRRLALVSSLLANIREDFHRTIYEDAGSVTEVKENYSLILRGFMTAMKGNYLQLRQQSMVTGAYVEFVQKVVQFLQEYTADICPILDFFTNSAAFPLPATDPTYVVGRLCGYAPKLTRPGVPKQLSVFVQTVAQQAAAGSQQIYLLSQLKTALCTDHSLSRDRIALRDVLLQGIFPSYIEAAFGSVVGFVVAKPILQCLKTVFDSTTYDIRVFDDQSIRATHDSVMAISHAFIRSTEQLRTDANLIRQPYVLHAIALLLDALSSTLPLLDYIYGRCSTSTQLDMMTYLQQFNVYIAEALHGLVPQNVPMYDGDAHDTHCAHIGLLSFCTDGLATSMRTNWSNNGERVYFGHGHAKREVPVDLGSTEEETMTLANAIKTYDSAVAHVYGERFSERDVGWERKFIGDVDV